MPILKMRETKKKWDNNLPKASLEWNHGVRYFHAAAFAPLLCSLLLHLGLCNITCQQLVFSVTTNSWELDGALFRSSIFILRATSPFSISSDSMKCILNLYPWQYGYSFKNTGFASKMFFGISLTVSSSDSTVKPYIFLYIRTLPSWETGFSAEGQVSLKEKNRAESTKRVAGWALPQQSGALCSHNLPLSLSNKKLTCWDAHSPEVASKRQEESLPFLLLSRKDAKCFSRLLGKNALYN